MGRWLGMDCCLPWHWRENWLLDFWFQTSTTRRCSGDCIWGIASSLAFPWWAIGVAFYMYTNINVSLTHENVLLHCFSALISLGCRGWICIRHCSFFKGCRTHLCGPLCIHRPGSPHIYHHPSLLFAFHHLPLQQSSGAYGETGRGVGAAEREWYGWSTLSSRTGKETEGEWTFSYMWLYLFAL